MKKRKILTIIGIALGLILVIGIVGTCYYTGVAVFSNSMQLVDNDSTSFEKAEDYFNKIGFDLEGFKSRYNIETVQIESSFDGHMIPFDHITVDGYKNKDTIIMVHGLGGNRWTNYPIADMFLKNGYNVISYDQRSSGENTAPYTTFGYLESYDLGDCVSYLIDNLSPDKKIGIWGTSFGGATAGIYLGSDKANEHVDFAILDCPISSMSYMLSTEMEGMNTGIPIDFLMSMGNMATKMKLGFSYEDADVCKHIEKTKVPVLVINTKIDKVTPYFMGVDIFNSVTHDNKKIFTVEDSPHAEIFFDYPDEYEKNIIDFINEFAADR